MIMNIIQKEIKIEPRIKLNYNINLYKVDFLRQTSLTKAKIGVVLQPCTNITSIATLTQIYHLRNPYFNHKVSKSIIQLADFPISCLTTA